MSSEPAGEVGLIFGQAPRARPLLPVFDFEEEEAAPKSNQ